MSENEDKGISKTEGTIWLTTTFIIAVAVHIAIYTKDTPTDTSTDSNPTPEEIITKNNEKPQPGP